MEWPIFHSVISSLSTFFRLTCSWVYIKDILNNHFRHIRLENNENKPVTNSRDTQVVPNRQGTEVMTLYGAYQLSTSILDDFNHYNLLEEEQQSRLNEG